jgi:predicted secreted protein
MLRPLVWSVVLFAAFPFGLGQSRQEATEAEKLKLDQEKFAYEKYQSSRNLFIGFILTTIGGAYVTWLFSTRTWHRQTRIDLYRRRYEEGTAFLDTFAKAVGERYFLMQRFLWILGDADTKRIQRIEKEYFLSVISWNASYWVNRNKIRLLVDDKQANAFLDYQDDFRLETPQSLHYLFVKAHRHVLKAKAGEISKADAQPAVDNLNWACSTYLENLTTSFLDKATSLQLLKTPSLRDSSLKAAIEQRPGLSIPPRLWGFMDGSGKIADESMAKKAE